MAKKSPNTSQALGIFAITLSAFALISSLLWTSSMYTGASVTDVGHGIGYYGAVAIFIAFLSLIFLFHKHQN